MAAVLQEACRAVRARSERPDDWKALETFAGCGAWHRDALEHSLAGALGQVLDSRWYAYRVWAGDDTKVPRSSADLWGTRTFHEYTARCPNRAGTVRARNGVGLGPLLPRQDERAVYLPVSGRLYFRRSQLPQPHRRL